MHTRYIQVGGVMEDIPRGFAAKLRTFLAEMPTRADQYADLLEKNQIVLRAAARHVCPLDAEDAALARRHRPAAARRRQPVGPAQGGPVLQL